MNAETIPELPAHIVVGDLERKASRYVWLVRALLVCAGIIGGYITSQLTVHQRITALEDKMQAMRLTVDGLASSRENTNNQMTELATEMRLLSSELKHLRELLEISRTRKAAHELSRI